MLCHELTDFDESLTRYQSFPAIMRKYIAMLLLLVGGTLPTRSQDRYEPRKALTSEELFFKQNGNQKSRGNAGQKFLALDYSPLMGGFRRYRFFPGDKIKFRMRNKKSV